jgi:hypothetical protein
MGYNRGKEDDKKIEKKSSIRCYESYKKGEEKTQPIAADNGHNYAALPLPGDLSLFRSNTPPKEALLASTTPLWAARACRGEGWREGRRERGMERGMEGGRERERKREREREKEKEKGKREWGKEGGKDRG